MGSSASFWPRAFVAIAILEAISWIGLLIAMYFKWISESTDVAVGIAGPIHGALFLVYIGVTLITASRLGWKQRTTLIALACSVPPLATIAFERWTQKRGMLEARITV